MGLKNAVSHETGKDAGEGAAAERLEYILHDLEELKLIQVVEIDLTGVNSPACREFFRKAAVADSISRVD